MIAVDNTQSISHLDQQNNVIELTKKLITDKGLKDKFNLSFLDDIKLKYKKFYNCKVSVCF